MNIHKPTGTLLPSEAEVEDWFVGRMTADGWRCIKTDAGKVTRGSGTPAHEPGTLDYVCVRPWKMSPRRRGTAVSPLRPPGVLYIELKRGKATTGKKRLANQTATAAVLRREGYEVCHVPEGHMDPIQYIQDWYNGMMARQERLATDFVYRYLYRYSEEER